MSQNSLIAPILIDEDFVLDEFKPEDEPALLETARKDGFVYAGLNNYHTHNDGKMPVEQNVKEYLYTEAIFAQTQNPRNTCYMAIRDRSTGKAIGAVEFLGNDNGSTELAYYLDPDYQGRGLATRAVCVALPRIVEELGITSMWATAHPENDASIAILEKLGFARSPGEELPPGHEHEGFEGRDILYPDARVRFDVDLNVLLEKAKELLPDTKKAQGWAIPYAGSRASQGDRSWARE